MILVTNRELTRAWRELLQASTIAKRTNPYRLMLFYAAECGLKAIYLRQQQVTVLDSQLASEVGHNLNKVMDKLRVGKEYRIPEGIQLSNITHGGSSLSRNCGCGDINQIWRYGAASEQPSDDDLEAALEKVNEWIRGELK